MKTSILFLLFGISVGSVFSQKRIIDLPNSSYMDMSSYLTSNQERVLDFRLDDLREHHDSLNFRFWTDRQLLDFKRDLKGNLSLNVYYFVFYSPFKSKKPMQHIFLKQEISKNDAVQLWGEMLKSGILFMPDQNKIKGWGMVIDGYYYSTELSTDSLYKFATYSCPEYMINKCSEAKAIVEFIELVNLKVGLKKTMQNFIDSSPKGMYSCDKYNYWMKKKKIKKMEIEK